MLANGIEIPYKQEVAGSSPALPTIFSRVYGLSTNLGIIDVAETVAGDRPF